MKFLFLICLLAAPCWAGETLTSSVSSILNSFLEEDDGATWSCRVCHYSNWKQSPPYTCENCGMEMGRG